jgi:hypothetical protein
MRGCGKRRGTDGSQREMPRQSGHPFAGGPPSAPGTRARARRMTPVIPVRALRWSHGLRGRRGAATRPGRAVCFPRAAAMRFRRAHEAGDPPQARRPAHPRAALDRAPRGAGRGPRAADGTHRVHRRPEAPWHASLRGAAQPVSPRAHPPRGHPRRRAASGRGGGGDGRRRAALVPAELQRTRGLGDDVPGHGEGAFRRRARGRGGCHEPLPGRGRPGEDPGGLRAPAVGGRRARGAGARRTAALRGARKQRDAAARLRVGRRGSGVPRRGPRLHRELPLAPAGGESHGDLRHRQRVGPAGGERHLPRQPPVGQHDGPGNRHHPGRAIAQGARRRPRPRWQLRRQGRRQGHLRHSAPLAQVRGAAGQVDRGPGGVPDGRGRPVVGPPLPGLAGGAEGRRRHRTARRAARRPGGHGRELWRHQRGEAAGVLHRLLRHSGGGLRPDAGGHQQAALDGLPGHGTASAQRGARADDGRRGPRPRPRPCRDPAPQLHRPGPLPLRDPQRQRVRQRRLRGDPTTGRPSTTRWRWPTTLRCAGGRSRPEARGDSSASGW